MNQCSNRKEPSFSDRHSTATRSATISLDIERIMLSGEISRIDVKHIFSFFLFTALYLGSRTVDRVKEKQLDGKRKTK